MQLGKLFFQFHRTQGDLLDSDAVKGQFFAEGLQGTALGEKGPLLVEGLYLCCHHPAGHR